MMLWCTIYRFIRILKFVFLFLKNSQNLNKMAAPMKKTVELFYDVVSPYSWIAFEVRDFFKQG